MPFIDIHCRSPLIQQIKMQIAQRGGQQSGISEQNYLVLWCIVQWLWQQFAFLFFLGIPMGLQQFVVMRTWTSAFHPSLIHGMDEGATLD